MKAYTLQWPLEYPRSPHPKDSRFGTWNNKQAKEALGIL